MGRGTKLGLVLSVAVSLVVQLVGIPSGHAATATVVDVGMARLNDVWCTPGPTCLGVGTTSQNQGAVVVLGPAGPIGPVRPVPGTTELWSVACSAGGSCVAVGQAGQSGVVVQLGSDGTPGAVRPVSTTALYGVACPTASVCLAVGTLQTVSDQYPYLIVSSWYVVITDGQPGRARPFGTEAGAMISISCATATRCLTVGHATIGVVSSENGAWSARLSATPGSFAPGAGYPTEDISCPTATQCYATAAGFIGGGGVPAMMPVSADGVPGPVRILSNGSGVASGISCVASATCTVVGADNASNTGISVDVARTRTSEVTYWAGSTELIGVSCVTAASCGVAGYNIQRGVFGWKGPPA